MDQSFNMDSLQGQFLIATPQMPDPRFAEQVVLVCAHNADGAIGLIINRPMDDVKLADVLRESGLNAPDTVLPPVYAGGPVETGAVFILYTNDYGARSFMPLSKTLSLTRDIQVIEDISRGFGPKQYMVFLGYAGWGPGQLETELATSGWLALPASDEIIFSRQDTLKWRNAAGRFGIDITTFSDLTGNA